LETVILVFFTLTTDLPGFRLFRLLSSSAFDPIFGPVFIEKANDMENFRIIVVFFRVLSCSYFFPGVILRVVCRSKVSLVILLAD